jgi:hypothetical protein
MTKPHAASSKLMVSSLVSKTHLPSYFFASRTLPRSMRIVLFFVIVRYRLNFCADSSSIAHWAVALSGCRSSCFCKISRIPARCFFLPLGLLGITAKYIALAHLAVADNHLFGLQVVSDMHDIQALVSIVDLPQKAFLSFLLT